MLRAAAKQGIVGMGHLRPLLRRHGLFIRLKLGIVNLGRLRHFQVGLSRSGQTAKRQRSKRGDFCIAKKVSWLSLRRFAPAGSRRHASQVNICKNDILRPATANLKHLFTNVNLANEKRLQAKLPVSFRQCFFLLFKDADSSAAALIRTYSSVGLLKQFGLMGVISFQFFSKGPLVRICFGVFIKISPKMIIPLRLFFLHKGVINGADGLFIVAGVHADDDVEFAGTLVDHADIDAVLRPGR